MAMTYHDTAAASRGNILVQAAQGVFEALIRLAENNGRYKQVQALEALSDAELAERGLAREDIVRHVYRDMFYI